MAMAALKLAMPWGSCSGMLSYLFSSFPPVAVETPEGARSYPRVAKPPAALASNQWVQSLGNRWVRLLGSSRASTAPPTFHGSPDNHLVQRLATTWPLTRTSLAHAIARVAAVAVEWGFDTAFDATSPTYASSSSIVRGAGVGTPLTAKSLTLAEGALTKSLAAFPGMVWPTLHGLDVIDDVPSSENSSTLSKGITARPFAPAAAFAFARWGGFVQRLAPSRFKETQGTLPLAVFWHFAAAGPPSVTELPSAIAPAVFPTPVLRVGPNFGAIVGAFLV
jgi:hypothetical protein